MAAAKANNMKPLTFFDGKYPIYASDKPAKKYYALVNGKRVYFGATGYQQYKDRVGLYSKDDHLDPERRARFYMRHPVDYPEGSADWFAKKVLW